MTVTGQFILGAIILIPIFTALVVIIVFRKRRRGRRTPLTSNLLRGPGESLRTEIERVTEKMDDAFFYLFGTCIPPLLLIWVLAKWQVSIAPHYQLGASGLVFLALLGWWSVHMYRLLQHRANLYLGLDAELAVGQELNQLMLQGCRVYHDFPAENFNIDHVVAGPAGVFAVETKGRAKPDKGRGSVDATVVYDGQILRFPDWHETEPLEQAKRQADWLQKWVSSAVGESVPVKPALAFPGWFIERTKPGGVLLFNGKNPLFLAKPVDANGTLEAQLVQRIAHQIEQRCRDVEPVAYRKNKK